MNNLNLFLTDAKFSNNIISSNITQEYIQDPQEIYQESLHKYLLQDDESQEMIDTINKDMNQNMSKEIYEQKWSEISRNSQRYQQCICRTDCQNKSFYSLKKSIDNDQLNKQQINLNTSNQALKMTYQCIEELDEIERQVINSVCCWNCTLQIQNQAIFLIQPDEISDGQGSIISIFCSYCCGFSWIRDRQLEKMQRTKYNNQLKNFFKLKTNKILQYIQYAPSQFSLQKFGGILSGDQFRSQIVQLERQFF